MLRFLKMDLIAACVAVTSLFLVAHRYPVTSTPANQTEGATHIAEKALVAQTVVTSFTAAKVKLHRPMQMLANLGIASWYGAVLEGHKTASGEIFHKDDLTACHRTLPFGTMVKVVDVSSGRSVVVRINDRGILAEDRIIDLSAGAADSLGILRAGVARVRLEVLKTVVELPGARRSLAESPMELPL